MLSKCNLDRYFVGGSLFAGSKGHNVAEATLAGCAVLVGAHHETFKSMIDDINSVKIGTGTVAAGEEDGRKNVKVVTCERELFLGVKARLHDASLAAALGDAGMAQTRALLSGVLERLWSALSAHVFLPQK